jgi:hypothetical protein
LRKFQIGLFDPVKPGSVELIGQSYQDTPDDRARMKRELQAIADSPRCTKAAGVFEIGVAGDVLPKVPKRRRPRKPMDGTPYIAVAEAGCRNVLFAPHEVEALEHWISQWVRIVTLPHRSRKDRDTTLTLSVVWS